MKVIELLSDESKWTRNAFARNIHGDVVVPEDSDACCWSIFGAILKCYGYYTENNKSQLIISNSVRKEVKHINLQSWNDNKSTTFSHIRDVIVKLDI